MTLSLILACFWVLAAAVIAFLPMRLQIAPGLCLLGLALPLLVFIGLEHGGWIVVLMLVAIVSMFRRPLLFLMRRLMGRVEEGR